jgi:hypothetical protein
MRVRIEVRNKDLDLIDTKEYEIEDYFDYLSRRTTSLLYLTEEYKMDLIGHDILRNAVLDLAGHLKRLPENLIFEDTKDSEEVE